MRIAFSWDDGAPEDIKLMDLHEKYEVPGMFFVPTVNCEGRKTLPMRLLIEKESKNISFGGHTQNHRFLTDIPFEHVSKEIQNNKDELEYALGHKVKHFCLPGGRYNHSILDVAFKHYTTVRTAETMCFEGMNRLIRPSFHFYPRGIKSLIGNGIRNKDFKDVASLIRHYDLNYFEVLYMLIENHVNSDESIIIWGHSWEIEEFALWNQLERFIVRLKDAYGDSIVNYDGLYNKV